MLVLSRKKNESFVIGHNAEIEIVVVEIQGHKVKFGIQCPKEIPVHRREVYDAIQREGVKKSFASPELIERAKKVGWVIKEDVSFSPEPGKFLGTFALLPPEDHEARGYAAEWRTQTINGLAVRVPHWIEKVVLEQEEAISAERCQDGRFGLGTS